MDGIHLTLAYLPDSNLAREHAPSILEIMNIVRRKFNEPLQCSIQGYGVFNGKDGMKVLYATLDCPQLPFLRTEICNLLDSYGIPYGKDYGFVPHITLAYFPEDWKLPRGFEVEDMKMIIESVTFTLGMERLSVPLLAPVNETPAYISAEDGFDYMKHCGVCDGDAEFFGAPVVRKNGTGVIMRMEEGGSTQDAIWVPADGSNYHKFQEAAWLLDQSLGFQMVPLAYVTETPDGEEGAAVWNNEGLAYILPDQLNEEWRKRFEILSYVFGKQPVVLEHPDEQGRGLVYGIDFTREIGAGIAAPAVNPTHLEMLKNTLEDVSMWKDMEELIGSELTEIARRRVADLAGPL